MGAAVSAVAGGTTGTTGTTGGVPSCADTETLVSHSPENRPAASPHADRDRLKVRIDLSNGATGADN